MKEFDIIAGNNHNREMLVQERTETGEFEKGHPVGYINKYGKQKQSDGSWKYVGKQGGGSTKKTTDKKESSKPSKSKSDAPEYDVLIGKTVEVYPGQKDKIIAFGKDRYKLARENNHRVPANPMGYATSQGVHFLVERNGHKTFLEPSFGPKALEAYKKEGDKAATIKAQKRETVNVAKSIGMPNASKADADRHVWSKRGGHAAADKVWGTIQKAKDAGWKRKSSSSDTHVASGNTRNESVYVSPDGKFELSGDVFYGATASYNTFTLTLKRVDKIEKAEEILQIGEFEKGHPVGYINKYGKQKQGDGSWKYVGKGKGKAAPKAEEKKEGLSGRYNELSEKIMKNPYDMNLQRTILTTKEDKEAFSKQLKLEQKGDDEDGIVYTSQRGALHTKRALHKVLVDKVRAEKITDKDKKTIGKIQDMMKKEKEAQAKKKKEPTFRDVLEDRSPGGGREMIDLIEEYIGDLRDQPGREEHMSGLRDKVKELEKKTGYKYDISEQEKDYKEAKAAEAKIPKKGEKIKVKLKNGKTFEGKFDGINLTQPGMGWLRDSEGGTKPISLDTIVKSEITEALDILEKGRKMPIGTVSNGRKKVAEGKWVDVKEDKAKSKEDKAKDSDARFAEKWKGKIYKKGDKVRFKDDKGNWKNGYVLKRMQTRFRGHKNMQILVHEDKNYETFRGHFTRIISPENIETGHSTEIKKSMEAKEFDTPEEAMEVLEKAHPVGYINAHGKQKQADGTWKYVGRGGAGGGAAATTSATTDESAGEGATDHTHLLKDIEKIARNTHTPQQKMKELIDVGLKDVGKVATISGMNRSDVAQHFIDANITPEPSNINAETFKGLLPKIPVEKRWKSYRVMLNMVAKGLGKSMIAYGTGGVGKTYNQEEVFKGHNLKKFEDGMTPGFGDYDYVSITGKSTPAAMFKALYEHNGKTVVFDDCDSVLEDDTSVNILKGALDTTGDGTISYLSGRKMKDSNGEEIPQRFTFLGKALFISNLTSEKMPQPLRSRAFTVDLTMNADETVTMLKKIAPEMKFKNNRGERITVPEESRNAAVNLIDKYKNQIDIGDLNARTLGQIAMIHKQFKENPVEGLSWEDTAITMLS